MGNRKVSQLLATIELKLFLMCASLV